MKLTTFGNASVTERYPKVVLGARKNEDVFIIPDTWNYNNSPRPEWVNWNSPTLEPETEIELVIGRDYDTLVMDTDEGITVLYKRIPPPELNYLGDMTITWNNSYNIPVLVYRLRTFKGEQPASVENFTLIAEVNPDVTTYTDHRSINFDIYDYHYYVRNSNGRSNVLTVTNTYLFNL